MPKNAVNIQFVLALEKNYLCDIIFFIILSFNF